MAEWTSTIKSNIALIVLMILSIASFIISLTYYPEFAVMFAKLLYVSIALCLFYLVDKFLLTGIDIIDEIKKGNLAVAVLVCGMLFLIGTIISS